MKALPRHGRPSLIYRWFMGSNPTPPFEKYIQNISDKICLGVVGKDKKKK